MMGYDKLMQEHLRITILRLLAEEGDYSLNESLLIDLSERYGFNPSRDRMKTELAWLQEQSLVTLSGPETCRTARLTERGFDVAKGRVTAPGVKRPGPGEL